MLRTKSLFFTALLCLSLPLSAQTTTPAPNRGALDAEMAAKPEAIGNIDWYDVTKWGLEGREWVEQPRLNYFDRFPAAARQTMTPQVWKLSRSSTGMMVRFMTDAPALSVHYKLTGERLAMPHVPATSVSGIDFYARDAAGKWRFVQVARPTQQEMKVTVIRGLAPGTREYAAYLPLYNGVEFLKIGVPKGAKFEGMAPRKKPIVFYGTSITNGAASSRPGMVHTAILGRRFDRPVVNLGFSGNGRMDTAVGEYLTKIDAAVYVIDCLPNMGPAAVTAKCPPLVRQIRAAQPDTPILLVEDRRNSNSWITPARDKHHDDNHAALRAAYELLLKEGVKNLFYIAGDHLYGDDGEGATDASHASDLGFMRQADVMEPVIHAALEQTK